MITVIGASNIDYIATSSNDIILKDSNPGHLFVSYGGVGRNIAENIARLGVNTNFVTAIGCDEFGNNLKNYLLNLGINVISPVNHQYNTSSYIAICGKDGDLALGFNDMEIVKLINYELIDQATYLIEKSNYLVFDCNLEEQDIQYIVNKFKHKKLVCDAISVSKAYKLKKYAKYLYLLKVNELEYEVFKGDTLPQNLIISKGCEDIEIISDNEHFFVPVIKKEHIVNATGAGDSLLSGILYGLENNYSLLEAVKIGVKASFVTLDVLSACNENIKDILK